MRILPMILSKGAYHDAVIFKPETVAMMFRNHLEGFSPTPLYTERSIALWSPASVSWA